MCGEQQTGINQIRNCKFGDPGFIVQPLDSRHFSTVSLTKGTFTVYSLVPFVFPRRCWAVTAHEDKIDGPSPTLSASHPLDWDLPSTEHLGCPQELQQDEVVSNFHVPILNIS